MYVDFLTLACLRDRLDGLLGARVQKILLPDKLSVQLELYARRRFYFLASAHPQHARALLVPERLRRGVENPTPLLLLLRKWVRGAHLVDVNQPPWERILTLEFDGRAGRCRLVIETIGRYANIILVGPEGNVLDAAKRIGPDLNRYRVTLPAHPYEPPPPPPHRRPPTGLSPQAWEAEIASWEADRPLQRLLVRRFLAISPQLAREIAFRAAGSTDVRVADAPPERVGEAVEELFAPLEDGTWTPHVALDEAGEVIAFAPYEPRQFSHVEPVSSISAGMDRYFSQVVSRDPYAAVRKRVEAHVESARRRIESGLAQLESQLVDEEEIEALRQAGELLLTYQHRVERGASEVTLPDYEGEMRILRLDPTRTPVENAQAYFRRYEKAQRANEQIPARRTALRVDRAYVAQLAADLALAESRPEIDEVREALAEAGWVPKKRRRPFHKAAPLRFELDELPVYVGRNARQNEEVTFSIAGADDLWLHTRDVPGAHVVIKCAKQEVPEEVVQQAARLAAYYSPARGAKNVPVVVVERRFVRRVGKGRPGLVTYRNERVLHVTAELGFRSKSAGENGLAAEERP